MFLGRVPGMPIELVLATDCEWTFVAGKNCSVADGCARGVYDHHMTSSEKVNWTIQYAEVSILRNFRLIIIDSWSISFHWIWGD